MNRLQVVRVLCLVVVLICLTPLCVLADDPVPYANPVFGSASAFLSSSKLVVFDCTLYDVHSRISITNVWLEQKIDGEWKYVKNLDAPTYVATNMMDYGEEVDYSSDIGSGTFRVGFTVDADGYAISRYSNTRTF